MQTIDYWSGTDAGNGGASGTSFVDKNTGTGYEGTYVKSGWLNMIQSELVNAITDSGQSLSNSDNEQLKKAINKYIVTTDKTITVDYTNGSDITGNFDNSFATLQGAINWLSRVTIQRSATVTISVNANAGKRAETPIYFSHPQGNRVVINALNESAGVSVSSMSYSTPTITVNTSAVHGLSIGDYVTISGVSPSNWNLFGIVASTPTTSQFTITWKASLTIPAYSSGGTVTKQGNVFTFSNTNGFIVDGQLGELNIAVSQTGALSGAEKSGVIVGGLREVVSTTNYYNSLAKVDKGKIFITGFYNNLKLNGSIISNCIVISNYGSFGFNATTSKIILCNINSNYNNYGAQLEDSYIDRNNTINTNNCIDGFSANVSRIFSSNLTSNNNTRYGLSLYNGTVMSCTITAFSGNATYDLFLSSSSILSGNGLTALNHTSNCGFQTFYTTGSDSRFGCCINS